MLASSFAYQTPCIMLMSLPSAGDFLPRILRLSEFSRDWRPELAGRSSLANAICCTPTPTFLKWLPSLLMMLFNPTPLQQLRHLINSSRARAFPSSSPSAEVWGRCSFVSSISSQSELKISSKCPPLRRSNPSKPVPIKLNPSESPPLPIHPEDPPEDPSGGSCG